MASAEVDLKLAWRNGFFLAAALVTLIHLGVLWWIGSLLRGWVVALVLLEIFIFNGFYFAAGLVLLQKSENTLAAQLLTPLRPVEWVGARCLILSLLAVVEALLITLPVWRAELLSLAASAVLLTSLLCQLGLTMVQRYRSLSEFLMPSSLAFLLLLVPALDLVGVWTSPWLWLHPLMPGFSLLKSALVTEASQPVVLSLLLACAWLVPGQYLASRATRAMAEQP